MIAAVYLLIALFAANGGLHRGESVVCVGADGHIDVESFFDGCCGPVAHDDHGAGVNLVMDGSSCGDCVDVHLRVVPLKTRGGAPIFSEYQYRGSFHYLEVRCRRRWTARGFSRRQ